jgi:hypothetical protein
MHGGEDTKYAMITENTPLIENTQPSLSIGSILVTTGNSINRGSIVKVMQEISVEMKDAPDTKDNLYKIQVIEPKKGEFFVTTRHARIMPKYEPEAAPVEVPVASVAAVVPVAKQVAKQVAKPLAKIKGNGSDIQLRDAASSDSAFTGKFANDNSDVLVLESGIFNGKETDTFAKIKSGDNVGYIKEKYLIQYEKVILGSILEFKKGNIKIPMLQSPHDMATRVTPQPTINNTTNLEVLQQNIVNKQNIMSKKYAEVKYGTIRGYLPQSYINELS